MKNQTLFKDLLDKLYENIFPSIVNSLHKIGLEYCHILIHPHHSYHIFNYLRINFPFDLNELQTIKNKEGNDIPVLILSLKRNGELSISSNVTGDHNPETVFENKILLFNHYSNLFKEKITLDNLFILQIAQDFSDKAQTYETEISNINNLLSKMNSIKPQITREVLIEKE